MATYTTPQIVAAKYPTLSLTESSQPTISQVQGWIVDAAAEIEGLCIGRGYNLSTLTDQQTAVLAALNTYGAAAELGVAIMSKLSNMDSAEAKRMTDSYQKGLSRLTSGAYDKLFLPLTAPAVETGAKIMANVPRRPLSKLDDQF